MSERQPFETIPKGDAQRIGWVPWLGGERPVNGDVRVEVRFPDGSTGGAELACDLEWDWKFEGKNGGDIIAYRVVGASLGSGKAGWQPIETAPAGERILICWAASGQYDEGIEVATYSPDADARHRWLNQNSGNYISPTCPPTHWMPLPKPPVAA